MTASITLAELLRVEDDGAILDFRCPSTGALLWPQIRTVFLRAAMSDYLYETPIDGSVSKGVPASRALATIARSVLRNTAMAASGRCRADICLLSEGIANQQIDGKWLNRLSDHFAMSAARTLTVEDHFHWRWPFPRHNPRVMLHAPLQALNAITARLSVRGEHVRRAEQLVDYASTRAAALLGWRPGAQRERDLVVMLARKIAGMPRQFAAYERLLRRIRPKLLMLIGACYGPAATLVTVARRLGIVSAEYQHGTVSVGHDGYNFGSAVRDSAAYREGLPDHFLSYGEWWHSQTNAPVRMTAVGNPHRDFCIERQRERQQTKTDILILSDGVEFDMYLDLARQIESQARAVGLRVVLRPHPLERVAVLAKYCTAHDGVVLDTNPDLYTSLQHAHAVLSEVSTGLFEAAGLADRVFVWDTPKSKFCFPVSPFLPVASASELLERLRDERAGRLSPNEVGAIWAPRWRDNYSSFLRACGVSQA
jgi:hypothetical protein